MIVEVAVVLAVVLGCRALVHRLILLGLRAPRVPHALAALEAPSTGPEVLEARIDGPNGRSLAAWLCMPRHVQAPAPAVLVMHGWGGNASLMWPVVVPLHDAGFAVLLLDARCHGRSDDEAFTSMPRFAEDIAAGLAWLRQQPGIDPGRLALLGHSVGAAASLLHASGRDDVRAVISLSSFAHPHEVMRRLMADRRVPYPVFGWYVLRHVQRVIGARFDDIAPLHTISRVRCPVLLVHGRDDTTVAFDDARRLRAACDDAQLLAVAGDHDLRESLRPHVPQVVEFLDTAFEASPRAPLRLNPTADPACDRPCAR
jgi:uncharacterized protein